MLRTPLVIAATAAALVLGVGVPATSAFAAGSGDTAATFTLTGGSLDLTVQATAALTDAAHGTTHVTGSLGLVNVTDGRGGVSGWDATAASTAFTGVLGSSSTAVSYTGGTVDSIGSSTVNDGAATTLTADPAPVVSATAVSGDNSASWTPGLDVTMPAGALADDYSGTVTTSVA